MIQNIFINYDKECNLFKKTIIPLYNFVLRLYNTMNNRFKSIINNRNIIFIKKINQKKIENKERDLCNQYYSISNQNLNKISKNEKIEKIKVNSLKIKELIQSDSIESSNNQNQENEISKKFLFIGNKSIKQNLEVVPNYIETNEISNENEGLQSININLEQINFPKFNESLNELYNSYRKCITNIGLLPAFIGNSIIKKDSKEENLKIALQCFNDSYNVYKSIPTGNDFSIISPLTNEFKRLFEEIIIKLHSIGINSINIENKYNNNQMNYNIKGFMKYPEIEIYNIKNEKWISEDIGDNNPPILKYGNNKVDWSNIDGIRSDVTEINFEVYEKKDIEEYKEFNQSYINKSEEQNQEIEFDKNEEDNENIEYVEDTILIDESEEIDLKQIEDEINLNNINKDDDIGKKDTLYIKNIKGGKIQYKISAEKFREQDKNYNEYDTIKMCYTKMQNIKLDSKLKFIERYEKEEVN